MEKKKQVHEPIIEKLKTMMPIHPESYPFSFFGGAIGYFGYETAFYSEKIGELLQRPIRICQIYILMFYDTFLIYDHLKQTVTIAAIDLFKNGRT